MSSKEFSFSKKKRLKRKKWIQELFSRGKTYRDETLLCYYLPFLEIEDHQILIAVPKKKIRRAVVRNRIKRRMREAYRLQQHKLGLRPAVALLIGFVFMGSSVEAARYEVISKAVAKSIEHIKCDSISFRRQLAQQAKLRNLSDPSTSSR